MSGSQRRRRPPPLAALLIPAALALGSLGPVVLVEPANNLLAYAPIGFDAHSTDYWYPPGRSDNVMTLSRWNDQTLKVTTTAEASIVGASFAGDQWTFITDLVQLGKGPGGDEILWFSDSDVDEPYAGPIRGLRLMARRDASGAVTRQQVIAVGTGPPYSVAPYRAGRHRLVITSSWAYATVTLDGVAVWAGDPGWSDMAGAYPIFTFAPGEHRFSVVPRVEVSFPAGPRAEPAAFRAAFVEAALRAQDSEGRFSANGSADAWTAMALVLEHRRTGGARIADALDRWADGRVAAARPGMSWPGNPGPDSIRHNVGEPGIPLALWANDRSRQDWAGAVTAMIDAAGFSACRGSGPDWCRLGNLQPDGRVIRGGERGANSLLVNFQFAETAGFIAGADLPSRRDWLRWLTQRTYLQLPCQTVEVLGGKGETDQEPWSPGARRSHPTVMLLLGLAYAERPGDPVWSEPAVRHLLTCGIALLRSQIGGPMGWRAGDLFMDAAIGSQDVAASRLLAPVTGLILDRARFDAAWEWLIDTTTLRARTNRGEPASAADYRTAVAGTMLELVSP